MSLITALELSKILFVISILIQTLELIYLYRSWASKGIWRSPEVYLDHHALYRQLFSPRVFAVTLFIRLLCAVLLLWQSHWIFYLGIFFSTLLISLRWRGTFNGGSDMMTLIASVGLGIASLGENSFWSSVGLAYIAAQGVISYFVAGWIKIKKPNWRHGLALPAFLNSSIYSEPNKLIHLLREPSIAKQLTWATLIFELGFPLALINKPLAILFCSIACLFHLGNAYVFGLNRFLWAWAVTWPAIIYFA